MYDVCEFISPKLIVLEIRFYVQIKELMALKRSKHKKEMKQ